MKQPYESGANVFKSLADNNRLMILDMLSCGELCACDILEKLEVTQPTLSHHLKVLCDHGLLHSRKNGKWTWYSLNTEACQQLQGFLKQILSPTDNCICK